jgi:signal transduction histidine kinase
MDGDIHSDSANPLRNQSGGTGIAAQDNDKRNPGTCVLPQAATADAAAAVAREIKHPLTAIVMSANAARRWLTTPEPNLAEAIAALERIVKDAARVDGMIELIAAT